MTINKSIELPNKPNEKLEVSDIFKIAGIDRPDISILSDEFLKEVQKMEHKNLAVELLEKLLKKWRPNEN